MTTETKTFSTKSNARRAAVKLLGGAAAEGVDYRLFMEEGRWNFETIPTKAELEAVELPAFPNAREAIDAGDDADEAAYEAHYGAEAETAYQAHIEAEAEALSPDHELSDACPGEAITVALDGEVLPPEEPTITLEEFAEANARLDAAIVDGTAITVTADLPAVILFDHPAGSRPVVDANNEIRVFPSVEAAQTEIERHGDTDDHRAVPVETAGLDPVDDTGIPAFLRRREDPAVLAEQRTRLRIPADEHPGARLKTPSWKEPDMAKQKKREAQAAAEPITAKLPQVNKAGVKPGSSAEKLVDFLCRPEGATHKELCAHIGWKQCLPYTMKSAAQAGVAVSKKREGAEVRYFGQRSGAAT